MSEAIVPLVSVLLGAVLGAGATLVAEGVRARYARQHELLQVRREVELDALEHARRLVQRLADFVVENRLSTDDAAAAAADALFRQAEEMQSLSLRVQVPANFEVGMRIERLELAIRGFVLTSYESGAIDQVRADFLLTDMRSQLSDLASVIREDLRTAEVETRRQPWRRGQSRG